MTEFRLLPLKSRALMTSSLVFRRDRPSELIGIASDDRRCFRLFCLINKNQGNRSDCRHTCKHNNQVRYRGLAEKGSQRFLGNVNRLTLRNSRRIIRPLPNA